MSNPSRGLKQRMTGALAGDRTRHRLRHFPVTAGVVAVLAYGAVFAWYAVTELRLIDIVVTMNVDDSFYYFTIARNLAEGQFSTFDGGITQTNGYHPLWLLLITPFYWFFDIETALFAIKAFEIMLIAGGFALLVLAARVCQLPWILLLPALPAFYTTYGVLAGTEAAAASFLLCLLLLALALSARNAERWVWLLTGVVFVLPWVRLEYAAISVTAAAVWWLIQRQRQVPLSLDAAPIRRSLFPVFAAGLGITSYFVWNWLVFGTAVPVSGLVKQHWSQVRWAAEGGFDLLRALKMTALVPQFEGELLVAWSLCAGFALMWHSTRKSSSHTSMLLLVFMAGVFSLAVGHLAKFAQSALTTHPRHADFAWYFVPAYLLMALLVPVSIFVGLSILKHLLARRSHALASLSAFAITLISAAMLFASTDPFEPFRSVDETVRDTETRPRWTLSHYAAARVMNRMLPDNSVIGSWDAGIMGYFARFPVVNLDGFANSHDYYRWLAQSDSHRPVSPTVMRDLRITHLAHSRTLHPDHEFPLLVGYPNPGSRGGREFVVGRPFYWDAPPLPEHDAVKRAAEVWRSLVEKTDYRSDDTAVFMDGSLVQVFATDCDPDAWKTRSLSFSWQNASTGETATVRFVPSMLYPWRQDACSALFVLPRAAANKISISMDLPSGGARSGHALPR